MKSGPAGAKMTGGGGGGVVAILCCSGEEDVVRTIAEAYGKERGAIPTSSRSLKLRGDSIASSSSLVSAVNSWRRSV